MISAQIPEKIIYVCRPSQHIKPKFNEVEQEFYKTSAMPAFPVDSTNEKTLQTARTWAKQRNSREVHKEIEKSNSEIFEVQIVDLEIRAQGGRAYKAIVHGSFLVDIREDVMLEAMLIKGVRQGSFIASKFIWARIGAQMKLIRVGSSLHNAVVEANEHRKLKKVSIKELSPGKVYSNTNGYFLFLGFVKATNLLRNSYGLSFNKMYKIKPTKYQLWYYLHNDDLKNIETGVFKFNNIIKENYKLDFIKSKTVLPSLNVLNFELPKNHIDLIRSMLIEKTDLDSDDALSKFQKLTFVDATEKELKIEGRLKKIWDSAEFK